MEYNSIYIEIVALLLVAGLFLAMAITVLVGVITGGLALFYLVLNISNKLSLVKIYLHIWDLDITAKILERVMQVCVGYILMFQILSVAVTNNRLWLNLMPYTIAGIILILSWGYVWGKTK